MNLWRGLFNIFWKRCSTKSTQTTEYLMQEDSSKADLLFSHIERKRKAETIKIGEPSKKIKVDEKIVESLFRLQVFTFITNEAYIHEVIVPPDTDYVPLNPPTRKPAKVYPFMLDPFQKEAILCLENNQSILVSSHTGKTVIAMYAIAMSLRRKQVIYTTPIKALSRQKHRELYEEFTDVGLLTGDVTFNTSASCLVMTTEILRSMIYHVSEVWKNVAYVIFDFQNMKDKEQCVALEETIILLPHNVHYVFLFPTMSNARQFAEWICHIHKQPCHLIYTDYNPIPRKHYIYPAGGDRLHLVVDENGDFKEENFNIAMSVLRESGDASKVKVKDQRGRKGVNKILQWYLDIRINFVQ